MIFFKKRVSHETIKLFKDLETELGFAGILFYSQTIKIRLKTSITNEEKKNLKELFTLYNSVINYCKKSLKKHDKTKFIDNLKRAIGIAKELDSLLNFEEKYYQSKKLSLLLNKLEEKLEIIEERTLQINPEEWIILPGKKHGNYKYPDLLVSIGIFHEGKSWYECQELLREEGCFMLTLRQFVDFLNLLKSGKVFNGKGDMVSSLKLDGLFKDITEVRNPYRAEWLDARFNNGSSGLQITYHKINPNGSLQEVTEPLKDYLEQDKTPGIDLNSWLDNATEQGLPSKTTSDGSLHYWKPVSGAVAGFNSNSDGAILYCGRNPQYSYAGLGVRRAKIFRSSK